MSPIEKALRKAVASSVLNGRSGRDGLSYVAGWMSDEFPHIANLLLNLRDGRIPPLSPSRKVNGMSETPTYYGAQLLRAEHDLRLFRNNAGAFALRAELATTDDARADARGSHTYWKNRAFCQEATVRHLREMLQQSERS